MTEQPIPTDLVVVTAKRLDSDEVVRTTVAIDAAGAGLGQRAQLVEVVAGLYPDAEPRSFADDAATFLEHKLLIVAIYQRADGSDGADDADGDDFQQQLFAA